MSDWHVSETFNDVVREMAADRSDLAQHVRAERLVTALNRLFGTRTTLMWANPRSTKGNLKVPQDDLAGFMYPAHPRAIYVRVDASDVVKYAAHEWSHSAIAQGRLRDVVTRTAAHKAGVSCDSGAWLIGDEAALRNAEGQAPETIATLIFARWG